MSEEKEPKNRQNKDFVMFYRPYMDEVAKLAGENYTAYKLFMFICKHMDAGNALCVSNVALSEIFNCTTKTIQRATKYLKENGWIDVLKSGTTNVYIINDCVAWTSYANQKEYSKFNGTILLSKSENAEYLKNRNATNHFKTIDTEFVKKVAQKQEEYEQEIKEMECS